MNLQTLEWDDELCRFFFFSFFFFLNFVNFHFFFFLFLSFFGIDKKTLPKICSSSEIYGYVTEGPCKGIPIAGVIIFFFFSFSIFQEKKNKILNNYLIH